MIIERPQFRAHTGAGAGLTVGRDDVDGGEELLRRGLVVATEVEHYLHAVGLQGHKGGGVGGAAKSRACFT